ncbi:MAG: hypothetical protein KY476_11510 [Planctomycetes bacterium]|nr:hypothetical protein [Planctomycetota bacterium]
MLQPLPPRLDDRGFFRQRLLAAAKLRGFCLTLSQPLRPVRLKLLAVAVELGKTVPVRFFEQTPFSLDRTLALSEQGVPAVELRAAEPGQFGVVLQPLPFALELGLKGSAVDFQLLARLLQMILLEPMPVVEQRAFLVQLTKMLLVLGRLFLAKAVQLSLGVGNAALCLGRLALESHALSGEFCFPLRLIALECHASFGQLGFDFAANGFAQPRAFAVQLELGLFERRLAGEQLGLKFLGAVELFGQFRFAARKLLETEAVLAFELCGLRVELVRLPLQFSRPSDDRSFAGLDLGQLALQLLGDLAGLQEQGRLVAARGGRGGGRVDRHMRHVEAAVIEIRIRQK